jgi:DNA modification methylase
MPPRPKPSHPKVEPPAKTPRKQAAKCNGLDGKAWLRNSISVWGDIQKSAEETALKHPALFPEQLVGRLIETFLRPGQGTVLDPFAGTGSTLVAALRRGHSAVGFELSEKFFEMASRRIALVEAESEGCSITLHKASALEISDHVAPESIDLCVTSPPYWNILNQKRTADYKGVRHYGNLQGDLGTIEDYGEFLERLTDVFRGVLAALKPGGYCCVVVMDLRKKNKFFPFHSDLATALTRIGFDWDDLIVWNRQAEYNNLRPLGYPAVFRVNKVHEFVVILRKPVAVPVTKSSQRNAGTRKRAV